MAELARYPAPPAWKQLLAFFRLRQIRGIECVEENSYQRGGVTVTFKLPDMIITGPPRRELDVLPRLRDMFDLDSDSQSVATHFGRVRELKPVLQVSPHPFLPGCWEPFEIAVRAIVGQQVSVRGAATLLGRLVAQTGQLGMFPTPAELAESDLAGVGLTRTRIATLRNLAGSVAAGKVRLDRQQSLEETVEQLLALSGIGHWTAHYIAMRGLHHPDAFPSGDLILRRALAPAGDTWTARHLEEQSRRWRPYRAYAAVSLWNYWSSRQ